MFDGFSAKFSHDWFGYQLDREKNAKGNNQQVIEIAENRNKIRNEIDGR